MKPKQHMYLLHTQRPVENMSKEDILKEIEDIKEHILTLACCVNTDELSDRATELHRQLRKLTVA